MSLRGGRRALKQTRVVMLVALSRRMGMDAREFQTALWLGAALLTVTSSYTLVKTVRDSLFLSMLPATWLPWVYILVGIVTLAVSLIVGRLTQWRSPRQSLGGSILAAAAGLALCTFVVWDSYTWVPVIFYLYVNAYGLMSSRVLAVCEQPVRPTRDEENERRSGCWRDPRGPRRWRARVDARRMGSAEMVDCSGSGMLALSLPILSLAVRERDGRRTDQQVTPMPESSVPLVRVPYVRWLAVATLCSVIVTGLLDYQFKMAVQQLYPDAAQLASFFGPFYIGINVFALLVQLLGTRWLLQRLGAGSAAAVLPIGLAVGAGATLAVPGFATVLGAKAWDQTFRFSLNKAAVELLFFPLQPGVKRRAKAVIEAGIERVGDALAGICFWAPG